MLIRMNPVMRGWFRYRAAVAVPAAASMRGLGAPAMMTMSGVRPSFDPALETS
jgi:hypothetical protein